MYGLFPKSFIDIGMKRELHLKQTHYHVLYIMYFIYTTLCSSLKDIRITSRHKKRNLHIIDIYKIESESKIIFEKVLFFVT